MIVVLLAGCSVYAQKPVDKNGLIPLDSVRLLKQRLPTVPNRQVFGSLIDSLNKRNLITQHLHRPDSGLTSFLKTSLKETPFNGMKDSVMGEFLYYVKNNFGKERLQKVIKNFAVAGDSGSLNNFIGSKIKGFYAVNGIESFKIPSFDKFLNNKFNGAQYSVVMDNAGMAPLPWMHHLQVNDQLTIMDMPFELNYTNLSNELLPLQYNNLIKASFNKDKFQEGLQQKLGKYYDMKKFLLADMDVLSYVKDHFESELSQQVQQTSNQFITDPSAYLKGRISYDEMLKLDMGQIRDRIQPAGELQAIRERILGYEQLIAVHGTSMPAQQKDSLLDYISTQSSYLSSLEQLTEKIGSVKERLSASGVNANSVMRLQQSINRHALESLQQPSVIKEAAGSLLPLNGLQRFFTNVSSLNAGTFGLENGERAISTLLRGGAELSVLKNSNLFSGGLGSVRDGGLLKDAGLTNSLMNPSSFLQFLQAGKGETGKNNTRLTIINSNTTSPNNAFFSQLTLPRNVLTGTISKSVKVRRAGLIEAELSKSATQYKNTLGADADRLMEHKSALYSYADDLLQTISAGIRYMDQWEQIGLSHNAHVAYAGFGYSNPGNPGSSRGSWQYDLQVRKHVDKSKGYVQAQFANRHYNYSANGGQQWNNMQVNLQGRYKFSRQLTLGGRWNQYQMVRREDGAKEKMYVSRKVMADAQYAGTVRGLRQRSNFSLGWQRFDNIAIQQGGNSNLLLVQYAGTVPMGNILGMTTFFYNKEIADHALMGDLLTAEVGAGYSLFKILTLSSSLTYLNNNIAARQLGMRQTVNTGIGKNCSVGVYIDYRKNLITPINSYLYGNFRGELTVQYQLK